MTKITIAVKYNLMELKEKYAQFYATPKNEKITKADIATWLGGLAEADIMDLDGDND